MTSLVTANRPYRNEGIMKTAENCLDHDAAAFSSPVGWKRTLAAMGVLYCRIFHGAVSRPVKGRYRCWHCLREFRTEW